VPIYPYEGDRYNDPINKDVWSSIIENIYKITGHREDYVNPTTDEELSWSSFRSYDTYSKDALDRW
jgi:hypothetical protein